MVSRPPIRDLPISYRTHGFHAAGSKRDKEGWILIGVEADVRALLKRALESNNPEGRVY